MTCIHSSTINMASLLGREDHRREIERFTCEDTLNRAKADTIERGDVHAGVFLLGFEFEEPCDDRNHGYPLEKKTATT